MFGIGISEFIVILVILLVLFGANRLPEMGKALGKAIKEFKGAAKELTDTVNFEDKEKKQ